ncbi:MAG: NAD-dependent epimerase/dehydratase family protein, partial [Myxococcales bacterium]|nr:NAD-dependent epimerase/dehydratase family protein [Myxococcales bacterium]
KAFDGVDLVLHCASIVDWGQHGREFVRSVNVGGTEAVVAACRAAGVRALVYTSTMDVAYDGRPVRDGDEDDPLPAHPEAIYPATKAEAERIVLAANGPALRACVVRPCGMYGEGDPYNVSATLRMARRGMLQVRMGDGRALFQHVYVGNVAHAHLVAAHDLLAAESRAAGQVYLATDHPPRNFFEFLAPIVEGVGYRMPPPILSLPFAVVWAIGGLTELACWALRPIRRVDPVLTRLSARLVCHDFTFSGEKIRRELGYSPAYSEEDAVARTIAYFREHSV